MPAYRSRTTTHGRNMAGVKPGEIKKLLVLETLPMPQREAIDLAFFGGMTQAEISTKLGTPLGTVKARIRRGLLALREVLPRISA